MKPWICLLIAGALMSAPRPSATKANSAQIIAVGPNVQVSSQNTDRAHWEVRVAADPVNVRRLLACSMIHSSEQDSIHTIVYASSDGGQSWKATLESDRTTDMGDPDCVFGIDGAAHFVTLATHFVPSAPSEMLVYRSLDAGWTWEQPAVLPFLDREYLTVDQSSGKQRGRIYLHGNAFEQTVDGRYKPTFTLFRSNDRGASFQLPIKIISDSTHFPLGNGNGEVLSDGTYVSVFPEWSEFYSVDESVPTSKPIGSIKLLRSENGGGSFAKAAVISSWYQCRNAMVSDIPMIAADHTNGPFKDRLYAVWSDERSGHCDIRFSYSVDKGVAWSPSRVINDEPDPYSADRFSDHFMPVLAVNNQGVIGISWYDRRDSPDDMGWWPRFTASLDGGEVFLSSVKLSEAPEAHKAGDQLPIFISRFRGEYGASTNKPTITTYITPDYGEGFGGDTSGMVADANGVFHAVWVDNRSGILQLWAAAVSVNGKAVLNGLQELETLADVSRSVILDFTDTHYDPKTGAAAFYVTMTNTSTVSIAPPIKLRVIGLGAGSGTVQILNADNQQRGTGAVWDFTDVVRGGSLEPGAKTGAKRFEFQLIDSHPFRRLPDGRIPHDLIKLESKVLARR